MAADISLAAIVIMQLLLIVITVYRMGRRHRQKYSKEYLAIALSSYDELIEQGCSIEAAHFITAFYRMHYGDDYPFPEEDEDDAQNCSESG